MRYLIILSIFFIFTSAQSSESRLIDSTKNDKTVEWVFEHTKEVTIDGRKQKIKLLNKQRNWDDRFLKVFPIFKGLL